MLETRHQEVLLEFVVGALATLGATYSAPEHDSADDSDEWSRTEADPELLTRMTVRGSWQAAYGTGWPDWQELRTLPSYARVNDILTSNADLMRRTVVVYGLPSHALRIGPDDLSDIERILQESLLRPQIERGGFDFDHGVFRVSLDRIIRALEDTKLRTTIYTPLRYIHAEAEISISQNCSLRSLTNAELSHAVSFGILPVERTSADKAYLPRWLQAAIVRTYEVDLMQSVGYIDQIAGRLVDNSMFEEIRSLDSQVLGALGLLPRVEAVDRGQRWLQSRTSAQHLSVRERSPNMPASLHSSLPTALVTLDDEPTIRETVSGLEVASVRDSVMVALNRLLSASTRHDPADALVDLAISAESLFGLKQPGEATHKIALNAALFLAEEGFAASEVRRFFKQVYAERSKIVHGSQQNDARRDGIIGMKKQLSYRMKSAIRKAIGELMENPDALNWEQRLDKFIDLSTSR